MLTNRELVKYIMVYLHNGILPSSKNYIKEYIFLLFLLGRKYCDLFHRKQWMLKICIYIHGCVYLHILLFIYKHRIKGLKIHAVNIKNL